MGPSTAVAFSHLDLVDRVQANVLETRKIRGAWHVKKKVQNLAFGTGSVLLNDLKGLRPPALTPTKLCRHSVA